MKKEFCIYLLVTVGILFPVKHGYAQQQDTISSVRKLKEVEVVEKRRISVTRSSAPLQLLNKDKIEELGVQDLSDAVRRFSGVTVKDYGGIGGLKTVSIRSMGAQHTGVSYDGVAVSDCQSGQTDISRFSLDNVESLALSIGLNDNIFQNARMQASSGVLNIETGTPLFTQKKYYGSVHIKGGSFGLFNPSLQYNQKINKIFTASFNTEWLSAHGEYPFTLQNGTITSSEKRKNTDIQTLRLEGNLYGDFSDKGKLRAKLYYYDSERGLPGAAIIDKVQTNRERVWDNNFFGQLQYENQFNPLLALRLQAKYNYAFNRYQDINNIYAEGKQVDLNTQHEYYGSGTLLYSPFKHFSASLATDFFVNKLINNFLQAPLPKRYTSLTALSAQYQNNFVTATASLLATYITEVVKTGDTPNNRKRLSPAISVSVRPLKSSMLRIRGSFKDGFRVPTFNDLYYLRMGNTNLRPEKATQYNLGITWTGSFFPAMHYFNVSADGYYNRIKDKIVAIPTMYIWKMSNAGEVDMKGADLNLASEITLLPKYSIALNGTYSFQHAIDITDKSAKNYRDQLPYTPKHSGSGSLSLNNPWVNITYSVIASGKRYAQAQNLKENEIDSYTEQNVSLNREFPVKKCVLRIQGEIINLTNATYDVIKYYPMPGRSYRLSFSLRI